MPLFRKCIVISAALALMLLSGCAVRQTTRTPQQLAAHRDWFVKEVNLRRADLSRSVMNRVVQEQDSAWAAGALQPTLDILIISGGGDRGAFGAGVLKGWGKIADPEFRRPEFDVVTGVSTGALIAPFAFLGTDEAYDVAYTAYRDPNPHWFQLRKLWKILLKRESFMDNSGLRAEVEKSIDDSVLQAIAQGREKNRLLLIGTTNLDLGMLTTWDATRLADEVVSGTRGRSTFDDVILASTAIPAVFPPVKIEGDLYVDGGVTRNIAYTTDYDFENSLVNLWKREQPNRPFPKTRVWVIVNNQLGAYPEQLHPTWPAVTQRSLEISIRAATISSLKSLSVSMEVLRAKEGVDIEFRLIGIPDSWRPPVKGSFKKETMNSLAEIGLQLGADPGAWRTTVPNPESPEN